MPLTFFGVREIRDNRRDRSRAALARSGRDRGAPDRQAFPPGPGAAQGMRIIALPLTLVGRR
jgi:hypothetical protein